MASASPAPIIVTAVMGQADQAWLDRERTAHFPAARNHLAAHLTMFHHLPPSLAGEIDERLRLIAGEGPPPARIAAPFSLGRGVAYRVESEALDAHRGYLADLWRDILTPQDRAPWRPHITIQNKVAPDDARRLLETIRRDFRPRPLVLRGYAAWWYRGGPWEPLSRHMCA